jgi:ribosomal protein L17
VVKQEKQEGRDMEIFRVSPIISQGIMESLPPLMGERDVREKPSESKEMLKTLGDNYNTFKGQVRDIRVEGQDLHALLSDLMERCKITNTITKSQEIQEFLEKNTTLFEKKEGAIKNRLESIHSLLKAEPCIYDYNGDEIAIIKNLWDKCSLELSAIRKKKDECSLISQITAAHSLLDEIIFHAGLITIPSRASQHLETLMTGQPLDFHETFKDELPQKKDRSKILQYLSSHPGSIDGIVVPEKGVIYKASRKRSRICQSLLVIAGTILLGAVVCYFTGDITGWLGISLPQHTAGKSIFTAYLFIILGALFHIGIDALKQVRSGEKEFLAIEKGFLWVQVKEGPILMSIFSLWLGLLLLIFYTTNLDWKVAFFVGYSIDSVVDLFLKRFSASASASLEAFTSEISS